MTYDHTHWKTRDLVFVGEVPYYFQMFFLDLAVCSNVTKALPVRLT